MVALATPVLGGVRTPSLARPMLLAASAAHLRGSHVEAAVRLREALRRHLASLCALHRLSAEGDAEAVVERLRAAGVGVCCFVDDLLAECGDVIALRESGKRLGGSIEIAFELIGSEFGRGGGA